MRLLVGLCVSAALTLSLGGCSTPRFEEQLREPNPWFAVESVEISEGLVTVTGTLSESVPATMALEPGVPQHFVMGLHPGPSATGGDVPIEPDSSGRFTVTYDFGEPRRGIYVLDFNKPEWGRQYIHVNLTAGEWAESDIW